MGDTIGIIQARMGSERLPGKILAPLSGRPLLALLSDRIREARVSDWWLATSSDPADDVTEAWGFELGLRVFRGHSSDVLSRFLLVGEETRAEWIVRVTADNPFLDAPVVDALLDARDASDHAKRADLVELSGGLPSTGRLPKPAAATSGPPVSPSSLCAATASPRLPLGYGVELVRRDALELAAREIGAQDNHHRTHVTSWLHSKGLVHKAPTPVEWPERADWRWTVDTYEDLAMARSAFRVFGSEATRIDYPSMVACLDAHPEITGMNQHVEQKDLEQG